MFVTIGYFLKPINLISGSWNWYCRPCLSCRTSGVQERLPTLKYRVVKILLDGIAVEVSNKKPAHLRQVFLFPNIAHIYRIMATLCTLLVYFVDMFNYE